MSKQITLNIILIAILVYFKQAFAVDLEKLIDMRETGDIQAVTVFSQPNLPANSEITNYDIFGVDDQYFLFVKWRFPNIVSQPNKAEEYGGTFILNERGGLISTSKYGESPPGDLCYSAKDLCIHPWILQALDRMPQNTLIKVVYDSSAHVKKKPITPSANKLALQNSFIENQAIHSNKHTALLFNSTDKNFPPEENSQNLKRLFMHINGHQLLVDQEYKSRPITLFLRKHDLLTLESLNVIGRLLPYGLEDGIYNLNR